MSQHALTIPSGQSGSARRTELQNMGQALGTLQSGSSAPATTYPYMFWADTGNGLLKQRNAADSGWIIRGTLAESQVVSKSGSYTVIDDDWGKSFVCTGTWSLVLTAAATLADNFWFDVRNNGSGTITIDPNSSEQIDGATTLALAAGESCTVVCNGSAFFTIGRSTAASSVVTVPVRQTVLSGPVDSAGLPAFGGSTGGTTVTMTGTLIATAANGFGSAGAVDVVGSGTNLSWTGLSTNGTMYLYVDISGGALSTGSTTLAPAYQHGGTYSTTSGQATFNVQEMTMKVGNGSSAVQTNRVFVGQVTVAGGVVTAITWYALQGRYRSAYAAMASTGTKTSYAHNLGVPADMVEAQALAKCTSAEGGWSVDGVAKLFARETSTGYPFDPVGFDDRLTAFSTAGSAASPWDVNDRTTGGILVLNTSKWNMALVARRGWGGS